MIEDIEKSPVGKMPADLAIHAEGLGKKYRIGVINRRMLVDQIESYVARKFGRTDPNSLVHEKNTDTMPRAEDFWALRNAGFSVRKGDIVGVMGRNGSGKSTLLKLLSRITAPTEGRAMLRGRVASLLEVGTGFHPELTGRENVFLNGSILGLKKSEIGDRYGQIVSFAEIEKFMDTPVKRYSSGMRVRLAFAVAAHLEPDILILDEVLAVGDAAFQEKCLRKIEDTKKSGVTILFVSHSADSVRQLCNRAIVLHQGKIECDAPVNEAVDYYTEGLHLHGIAHSGLGTRKAELVGAVTELLAQSLPSGRVLVNLPVETRNGTQIVDVAWISEARHAAVRGEKSYAGAPEICVHMVDVHRGVAVVSREIPPLFAAGAVENWVCGPGGYLNVQRSHPADDQRLVPGLPRAISLD
jgi:ABC-type polysaccharide/polyol phosphate transport system ATPase subunit